jgi:hypothetical protein
MTGAVEYRAETRSGPAIRGAWVDKVSAWELSDAESLRLGAKPESQA